MEAGQAQSTPAEGVPCDCLPDQTGHPVATNVFMPILQCRHAMLDWALACYLVDQVAYKTTNMPRPVHLHLWVDSGGGDAHAAYKLAIGLRKYADRITAVVPRWAKSAATLLVLGADHIVLGDAGELGPLDVQIPHPGEETSVSALDVVGAIEWLAEVTVEAVTLPGALVYQRTGIRKNEVVRDFFNFMAALLQPVVSKFDPTLLYQAQRNLTIGSDYARRLLVRAGMDRSASEAIAERLVKDYPSHAFVIDTIEASELGLDLIPEDVYQFQMQAQVANGHYAASHQDCHAVWTQGEMEQHIATILQAIAGPPDEPSEGSQAEADTNEQLPETEGDHSDDGQGG